MPRTEELVNLLVENKIITSEKLAEIRLLPAFKVNPEEVIIKNGLVDPDDLIKFKAKIYNLNSKNLADIKIPDQVLNLIPLEVAKNYKIVCFEVSQKKMKVGIVNPENFKAIEAIDFLAKEHNLQPEYFLISTISLENALRQHKTLNKEVLGALKFKAEEEAEVKIKKEEQGEAIEQIIKTCLLYTSDAADE